MGQSRLQSLLTVQSLHQKLADDAVTLAKLASDAVNSAKIVDGSIVAADLADASVTLAKLDSCGADGKTLFVLSVRS